MDALEFLNEFKRMCEYYEKYNSNCTICPLYDKNSYICRGIKNCNSKYILDAVERWSKEHPKRTYLSVLLEKFPKTVLNEFGIPSFCPSYLGFKEFRDARCGEYERCENCWNKEYKE